MLMNPKEASSEVSLGSCFWNIHPSVALWKGSVTNRLMVRQQCAPLRHHKPVLETSLTSTAFYVHRLLKSVSHFFHKNEEAEFLLKPTRSKNL
jgi:hypothetical protein